MLNGIVNCALFLLASELSSAAVINPTAPICRQSGVMELIPCTYYAAYHSKNCSGRPVETAWFINHPAAEVCPQLNKCPATAQPLSCKNDGTTSSQTQTWSKQTEMKVPEFPDANQVMMRQYIGGPKGLLERVVVYEYANMACTPEKFEEGRGGRVVRSGTGYVEKDSYGTPANTTLYLEIKCGKNVASA